MYTVSAMPRTAGEKRASRNFQFKLFGDEVKRWERVFKKAQKRALARDVMKITDTEVNRALLGLETPKPWLVTDEDRNFFFQRIGVMKQTTDAVGPTPKAVRAEQQPSPEEKAASGHQKNEQEPRETKLKNAGKGK